MNNTNNIDTLLKVAVKDIKTAILQSQYRAAKVVNREQLSLYFGIGKYVSENSRKRFWGTGAIESISLQLQKELPGLRGFGARNLKNMRVFYEEWASYLNSAAVAAELPVVSNQPPRTNDLDIVDFNLLTLSIRQPMAAKIEFLIQGYDNPMGVATYKTAEDVKKVLPSEEDLRRVMDNDFEK